MIENQKNYDPKMHSAEHILNQTMVRIYGCERSYSNHIEKKKSKCDYHFDHELSEAEITEINKRVNEVIQADLPVSEIFMSRDEADKEFDLNRIPSDSGPTVRVINIGDYDSCPCSGPHVSTTSEIGGFNMISSSFEDGTLRVRFKLKA